MFQDRREVFDPAWVAHYGRNSPEAWALAREMLFHDCPAEAWGFLPAEEAGAVLSLYEAFPLDGWPPGRREYVVCSSDRTIQPEWQRHAARRFLQVEPWELAAGHCPQLVRPRELAELLLKITEGSRTTA